LLPNFSFGFSGEKRALEYLLSRGYLIQDENVSWFGYEVDLIALDTQLNELVFVEVKHRQTGRYGSPATAVNYKKLQAMQRVASAYVRKHHLQSDYRFDIISITGDEVAHYQNVTWP